MNPETVRIDPDIRRATTLPAEVYRSRELFDLQRERVFARSWQWIPVPLPGPGAALPLTLLPGCLEEPLVLTRDSGNRPRALSNVCTHRGNLVCTRPGPLRELRCAYHGRRFGLDGRMTFMPEFEEVEGFPAESDHLPVLPLETWGPLAFTAIRPPVPFERWLAPVRERLDPLAGPGAGRGKPRDYEVAANWALYLDNYLEGFHIPYVHKGLNRLLDYRAYRTEVFAWGTLQIGIASDGEPAFELPPRHPDHGERVAAYYLWLFPNLMLNFYPWGISVNLVTPLAVDRTRITFLSLVSRPEAVGTGAGADLHNVELEDEAVVEQVQQGVRSRLYHRGRYSPTQERGPHHFHRLLIDAMAAS